MLWKFTQSPNVTRKDIQSTTKLPAKDILETLDGVARMRHGYGWTFRIDKARRVLFGSPPVTRGRYFFSKS